MLLLVFLIFACLEFQISTLTPILFIEISFVYPPPPLLLGSPSQKNSEKQESWPFWCFHCGLQVYLRHRGGGGGGEYYNLKKKTKQNKTKKAKKRLGKRAFGEYDVFVS